ncbi:FtsK/SpoIIIE domain-containing protein [Pseudonocardia alaniniphila]|uniref:Cell division protein FtsK n=1 Tax=Pseudonocardia alaniniphila TaxID=75291 RepID=A0ABS9TMV9_9PSEU|nr:FtsK/SpoIIIE domain-containing protein [Pseudonocardia alaniniphila]MCH6169848.1 cell division protein FtsK [Pseudonocardia alaniniphila]
MVAFLSKSRPRGGGAVAGRGSGRSTGGEIRALLWLARHPGWALLPAVAVWALLALGTVTVGSIAAGLLAGVLVWWRSHPPSFDRCAAPVLRSTWRRWTTYRGAHWRGVLDDCELTRENRRTGQVLVPRIVRFRAVTPSIDTLTVALVRGQDVLTWTDRAPALADALGAHRVAVSRARPGRLRVVVERSMPFARMLDAPAIPATADEVDLRTLDVGDTERGTPFRIRIRGKHLLVVGASGAGKGSLLWGPLRAMGPMIRDELVRLWVIDLKGGTETERGQDLFHRWATTPADALELLTEFRDSMLARQAWMREHQVRTCEITRETPYELLIIDELAMLTAYGDRSVVRDALRLLAEVLTQGRAADHTVAGYVQEPSKDVVDVRELFTTRICLGVTAASHVDMALGDGARDRGALADEIPGDEAHAGIGFVIDTGSRLPVRFRAGYVTDTEIDELVHRCTPGLTTDQPDAGEVLPFPTPTDQPDQDSDDRHDDQDDSEGGVA